MNTSSRRWWIVIAAGIMIMLPNLDATIVNLAVPSMGQYFHASIAKMQWVASLYMLGAVSGFIISGQLADQYGRKPIFLIGSFLFSISSLIIGYTHQLNSVLIMRFIQGIGFAGTLALAIAMIRSVFPENKHGLAIGVAITITGISQAIGPTLGGIILTVASWRELFLMNVPLGLISTILLSILYKDPKNTQKNSNRFLHSFIDMSVFKIKTFYHATIMRFIFMLIWCTLLFLLPIHLQENMHKTPLTTGFIILAMTVFVGIGSPITGKLIDKYGANKLILIGLLFGATGLILLSVAIFETNLVMLLIGLSLFGCSIALFLPSSVFSAMKSLPHHLQGKGMGIYFTLTFTGASIGIWLASSLETHMTPTHAILYLFIVDLILMVGLLIYGCIHFQKKHSKIPSLV